MGYESGLKSFCTTMGATLTGIADLAPFRGDPAVVPDDLLVPFGSAVSLAVALDDAIMNEISRGPTPEYSRHCRDVNAVLDRLSAEVVAWIEQRGYRARAIPASYWADTENLLGNISHKAVARMAGLGWQGKSLLLVNEAYGPRLRLATVLTDMPLAPDGPVKNRCGACTSCTDACPASAIRNASTDSRFERREDALLLRKCYEQLLAFKELPGIGYTFCGVCVSVCPFGKKKQAKMGEVPGTNGAL